MIIVASRSRWTGLFIGSVVPRFAGPGQGCGRVRGQAVSPESSIPDGVVAYINTGIERRAWIKKIRRQVRIAENFFRKSL
jgi:hypothetical protein